MFGRGVRLFKLFGFEVKMDWSWLIIAMLLTWSLARGVFPAFYHGLSAEAYWWMGVAGAAGLFISIVLHEFGHSIVARKFGIPMKGITLFIFGGVAEMGDEPPSPKSEFFMAIAGPVVTIFLAAIFYGLARLSEAMFWPLPVMGVLQYLAWINVVVLAFNLIPAFPLDGGRVLRSILWNWKKNLRWATRIASFIGAGFAYLLIAWGIVNFVFGSVIQGVWYFLIGLFIRNASRMSYQQVLMRQILAGEPVSQFMTRQPTFVPPELSVRHVVEDFLYRYPYKFYPVVENGHVLGCVTLDRVKEIPREQWDQRTAGNVAAPCSPENTIEPDADAAQALSIMGRNHSGRLMVVDHGELLGIIAFKDLLNFLSRKMELEEA